MFKFFKKSSESSSEPKKQNLHYYELKVIEIIKETSDAITIVFEAPEGGIYYKAGQFLTLICNINGEEVRRSYSLCTSTLTDKHPAVTVKRVEGGIMSNYLADIIKVGDTIKVMEPMGKFTTELNPQNKRHLVLFGGGSG